MARERTVAFMRLGRRPMVVSPAPQEVELGSAYLRKHYGPRATVGGARECLSSQALWRRRDALGDPSYRGHQLAVHRTADRRHAAVLRQIV